MKYIQLNEIIKDSEFDELFENFEVIEGVFEYRLKLISHDDDYKDPVFKTKKHRMLTRFMVQYGFNGEWITIMDLVVVTTGNHKEVNFASHADKIYVNGIEVPIIKDNSEYV